MNLASWYTDTVYVASPTGNNAFGELSYGTPIAVKARVEDKFDRIVGTDGNTVEVNHRIFTSTKITKQDRVWLPGDDRTNDALAKVPAITERAKTKARQVFYEVRL